MDVVDFQVVGENFGILFCKEFVLLMVTALVMSSGSLLKATSLFYLHGSENIDTTIRKIYKKIAIEQMMDIVIRNSKSRVAFFEFAIIIIDIIATIINE